MATRSYHHGNLREELLVHARETVRTHGLEALSLRELARRAGVSHAAPRRHFATRQELLDALVFDGFASLGETLRIASERSGDSLGEQFHAVATAYIGFATRDPDLVELMFAAKHRDAEDREVPGDPAAVEAAADAAFAPVLALILRGQADGVLPAGDPERVGLGQLATIHGIASLHTAGMIAPDQVDDLVEDAVAGFLARVG